MSALGLELGVLTPHDGIPGPNTGANALTGASSMESNALIET